MIAFLVVFALYVAFCLFLAYMGTKYKSEKKPFISAEEFWRTSKVYYPANKQELAWEFAEAYAKAALDYYKD